MSDSKMQKSQNSPQSQNSGSISSTNSSVRPGKTVRTSSLATRPAVQRKSAPSAATPPASGTPARSSGDWTSDPMMMAAHGFVPGPVQGKGDTSGEADDIRAKAAEGVSGSGAALPHLQRIQASFGAHDVTGIQAHSGGKAKAAAESIGAQAYATGNDVAFAGTPDLHTAAHEAAHVVQQRAGVHLSGGVGSNGDRYEQHADQVADAVVSGESAEGLLDQMAGGGSSPVQRKQRDTAVQRTSAQTAQTAQRRVQTAESLGQIDRFDDNFYTRAGNLLEAAVPRGGDKSTVQININLPVNTNVSVSFAFIAQAENAHPNFKAKCEVQAGITGRVDNWLIEAFAQAKAVGYLEAQGDSGAEVFRFLAYGLYDRVSQVSQRAADFVWGDTFGRTTRGQMQGDDYVETGVGVEVSAGLNAKDDDGMVGMSAGLRVTGGQRISNGGQSRENFGMVVGTFGFTATPFSGAVHVKMGARGNVEEIEFGISGERFVQASDFMDELNGGNFYNLLIDYVARAIGGVQNALSGQSGLTGNSSQAQRLGSVLAHARDASPALDIAGAGGVAAVSQGLESAGVPLAGGFGQKLTIKLGVVGNQGQLSVDLERVGRLEIGRNPRDPVYIKLESMSRILRIPPLTFSA